MKVRLEPLLESGCLPLRDSVLKKLRIVVVVNLRDPQEDRYEDWWVVGGRSRGLSRREDC